MGTRHVSVATLASLLLVVTLTGTLAADENWGLTKFDVKYVDQNFTIMNYPHHNKEFGEAISTQLFWGHDSRDFKWQLQIYPRGFKTAEKAALAVYLTLVSKPANVQDVTANVEVSIINYLNAKANSLKFTHRYTRNKESHGWSTFVAYYWIETGWKIYWLPNDAFTLNTKIDFSVGMIRASTKCSNIQVECTSLPFKNDYLSDIDIWVGEGIRAHKAALLAHSTWFKNRLDYYPSQTSIALPGESARLVKEVLRFIYEGKTDTSESNLEDLLEFAEKYSMAQLKLYAERELCHLLSGRNANAILKLANRFNAQNLKRETKNYITGLDENVTK